MKRYSAIIFAAAVLFAAVPYGCQKADESAGGETSGPEQKEDPDPEPVPDHDPVRPTGDGWTSSPVDDGIVYWHFEGVDPISGLKQSVHVADVDLNAGYELKFAYDRDGRKTSNVFKANKAVVAMNGGFGATQIFIKTDGVVCREIEKDESVYEHNGATVVVPNWRNDASICVAGDGSAFICNSICNPEDPLKSLYGGAVEEQRAFYRNEMASVPSIISGSPLLIYDYETPGQKFVPIGMTMDELEQKYPSEDPRCHQGIRHPRTAVAITGDGHLIMFVVDGRQDFSNGFSAKEMTRFLAANFDPRYAMNLDGGGSSTLCISGFGADRTHVVNSPSDAEGERTVQTQLYIVKKISGEDPSGGGQDDPKPVEIETDTIDLNIENAWAKEYMDFVYAHPYTTSDFNASYIENYYKSPRKKGCRGDCPADTEISWSGLDQAVSYTVVIAADEDMADVLRTITLPSTSMDYTVTNLIPGRDYHCVVSATLPGDSSEEVYKALIRTTGRRRMINTSTIGNVRDLGGLCTEDGRHVKYGLIYRGSRMSAQGMEIGSDDKKELLRIGIRADLDLRQDDKDKLGATVYNTRKSPLGDEVDWKLFPKANESYFKKLRSNDEYIKAVQWMIKELKAGKPVYFHCKTGADRTGTLASLVESLLGVTETDKSIDFELTSFFFDFGDPQEYAFRSRDLNRTIAIAGKENYDWGGMYAVINNNYQGQSLKEKTYNYLNKGIGTSSSAKVSSDDLDWFINYMLE